MITGVCKFCGCSEETACRIPIAVRADQQTCFLAGALEPADGVIPCAWLLEDVCTAPRCVAKAYAEARLLADEIMEAA